MRGLYRLVAVTGIAATVALSGMTAAAAAMSSPAYRSNTYQGSALSSNLQTAESEALATAQSQGYANGYRYGECRKTQESVYQWNGNYQVTVYVTCTQN